MIGSKAFLNWMIQCTSSNRTASIATHTLCLVISRASVSASAPCTQLKGGKVACSLVNSRRYFPSVSVLLSECSLWGQAAANCSSKFIVIQIYINQHLPNKDFSAVYKYCKTHPARDQNYWLNFLKTRSCYLEIPTSSAEAEDELFPHRKTVLNIPKIHFFWRHIKGESINLPHLHNIAKLIKSVTSSPTCMSSHKNLCRYNALGKIMYSISSWKVFLHQFTTYTVSVSLLISITLETPLHAGKQIPGK